MFNQTKSFQMFWFKILKIRNVELHEFIPCQCVAAADSASGFWELLSANKQTTTTTTNCEHMAADDPDGPTSSQLISAIQRFPRRLTISQVLTRHNERSLPAPLLLAVIGFKHHVKLCCCADASTSASSSSSSSSSW